MDCIFLLEDADRAAFLQQMMQAFGCVYICLKYYLPQHNCLRGLDGIYDERSISQGSLARRLFDVYRESSSYPNAGLIPGLAFTSNNPCMKLELHEFQTLASTEIQLQFYREARIKTVVLMGCPTGEIELGMSHHHPQPQVDLEVEMRNLIRINFPHHTDPNLPYSSSSSSLRSLSVDSPPEYPSLFNIPAASRPPPPFLPHPLPNPIGESLLEEALRSAAPPAITTATTSHDQSILALNQIRNPQFPSIESEEATMTKAILAVLSTSSSPHPKPVTPTAFRSYRPNPGMPVAADNRKHSKFKRSILFYRNLNLRSRQESQVQGNRPTATQMHHMISERRRREKLNESLHILRTLLPPGTKKDKASVLSSTTEYLSSLKSQVAELTKRNKMLESQLGFLQKSEAGTDVARSSVPAASSGERVNVEMVQVSSSSSSAAPEARLLDLRVTVGGGMSMLDLVIRLLEFLKRQTNVISLSSVESNTRLSGSVAAHAVIMRLRVEGDEFDESGFLEAVRRVVDDQTN